MEMEKICIELPIVKVEQSSPIFGSDFAKEHYEVGLFITDDGVMRHLMYYDGTYVNAFACPHDVIEKYIVEKAITNNDAIYHRDMEAIEDRLEQISRLLDCINGGILSSETRVRDDIEGMRDDFIDTIDERFSNLPKNSDNGANVLDVARAFAVISKPELIKELSK